MPARNTRQLETIVLLAPIVLFASAGNVLLAKGMKQVGQAQSWSPAALAVLFAKAFANPWVWLGIASLLVFLMSFMAVLSWADYSFVAPAAAVSYALAPLLSHWWLGEVVTPMRWAGVGIICLGVALITRTPARTTGLD
ncbi:MAG TPA: EamA family transporter [Terriglobia bacterium]|nr:EamA family transporter [Terriglobia bacterium]